MHPIGRFRRSWNNPGYGPQSFQKVGTGNRWFEYFNLTKALDETKKRSSNGMNDNVIITAAITGSIHTPTMSPYLPITPREIADEARKILGLKGIDKVTY